MPQGEKRDFVYQGRFLGISIRDGWEYCDRSNATAVVAIVPRLDDDTICLVEQYRIPVAAPVIEFPAGLVGDLDETESLKTAAERELLEETGFTGRLSPLFSGPTSPGMTSEIVHYFLAENLQRVHQGGGVGDEDIRIHLVKLSEIEDWLNQQTKSGVLIDPKVYAALYHL